MMVSTAVTSAGSADRGIPLACMGATAVYVPLGSTPVPSIAILGLSYLKGRLWQQSILRLLQMMPRQPLDITKNGVLSGNSGDRQ